MNGVVLGQVLGVDVWTATAVYATVREGVAPGWYTFTAEATGVWVRPYKADGTWEYANKGTYVERGSSRSFYIADREYSYYIPTGGTLRVERVKPISPYSGKRD